MTLPIPARLPRIATHLAVGLSVLSVVLTLILVLVIGQVAGDQVKRDIGNGLGELALQMADKLDRGMFERYREVQLMAGRAELRTGAASAAVQRAMLEQLQRTYPDYAWIGLAGLDGKVQAATGGLLEGVDVSARPWFQNARKGTYVDDVHEAVKLAALLPRKDGEPLRFVDVAFPVLGADGSPRAILGAHLYWHWARDIEQSIFQPLQARRHVEALVAGADGKILLGADKANVARMASFSTARTRNGYLVERWADGHDYLVGFARSQGFATYPGLGWTCLVRQNLDDAYAPVRSLQAQVLAIGLIVAAVFSLLGWPLARVLTRPLRDLSSAAVAVDRKAPAPLPPGRDSYVEVAELRSSLNQLITDLADANRLLEARVAERTEALAQALDEVRANVARVAAILAAVQDAYVAVDSEGRIADWNQAAEQMFGWRRDEVMGQSAAALLVPERLRPHFTALLQDAVAGRTEPEGRRERLVCDRLGRDIPVEAVTGVVIHGGQRYFSAFLHDISERKLVEQAKDEFIAITSHELRTPLTAMRASLNMLTLGMAGPLAPDAERLIKVAESSCERLVRLVNDMLDLEKMECGKMEYHFTRQPLAFVLEQARQAMEPLASQAGVALDLVPAPPGEWTIDPDRMQQVLCNLLSNAIKFSPKGSSVRLGAASHEGGWRLAVCDAGPGIPPAFQQRIFGRFAQAEPGEGRSRQGSGLGLSISKHIVEAHQGRIHFETAPGQGTCFYVDLPA